MSGTTISNAQTIGVRLTTSSQNPVTVTDTGSVITTSGNYAIYGSATTAWTISNAGTLSAQSSSGLGIRLLGSGSIDNSGQISGGNIGISIEGGGATITNQGSIVGTGGDGIDLNAGGMVSNGVGASITGGTNDGVIVNNAAGTVTNQGSIVGTGNVGIVLNDGGQVSNAVGASIIGDVSDGVVIDVAAGTVINQGSIGGADFGVDLLAGGTLTNAGTITGAGGTAVSFGAGNDLLILEQGYAFGGVITATGTGNTLELLGSAAAPVSVAYNNLGITNFGTVAFAAGADNTATLGISDTAALPQTIVGFVGINDVIDLTTLSDASNDATYNFNSATDVLTVTGDNGSVQLQLDNEIYAGFTVYNDGSDGTAVQPLCFCRGTQILTDRGEVAVERLSIGDAVRTLGGECKPVRWIGRGRTLVTNVASQALPIIVRANAIAPDVPHRDLRLTKGHSLYFGGVLIPVENLLNGRSILWDERPQVVEFFHLELDTHDILLADGAPAESYRDDGNGVLFHHARPSGLKALPPCAPIYQSGPVVERAWRELFERAEPTSAVPVTDDPDLHLLADGVRVAPQEMAGACYVFRIDTVPGTLRIVSRSTVPAVLGLNSDQRRLGVALRKIVLSADGVQISIDYDAPILCLGYHGPEVSNGFRWTDGDAPLPAALLQAFTGAVDVQLHIGCTARYPLQQISIARAA